MFFLSFFFISLRLVGVDRFAWSLRVPSQLTRWESIRTVTRVALVAESQLNARLLIVAAFSLALMSRRSRYERVCFVMKCLAYLFLFPQATFSLAITVPSFYVVLFNAALLESSAAEAPASAPESLKTQVIYEIFKGKKHSLKEYFLIPQPYTRHQFGSSPKMSSYLFAFFVGEADFVEQRSKSGVLVRVWTPVGQVR